MSIHPPIPIINSYRVFLNSDLFLFVFPGQK